MDRLLAWHERRRLSRLLTACWLGLAFFVLGLAACGSGESTREPLFDTPGTGALGEGALPPSSISQAIARLFPLLSGGGGIDLEESPPREPGTVRIPVSSLQQAVEKLILPTTARSPGGTASELRGTRAIEEATPLEEILQALVPPVIPTSPETQPGTLPETPPLLQPDWTLVLDLTDTNLVLGVKEGCSEPPLDNFAPGCNGPIPPAFPGSRDLPVAYLYYPENPTNLLQRLSFSMLPPAPVRLWQVVLTYPGDRPITLSWDFAWKGEESDDRFSLRLVDAEGFIDLSRPGSLRLPSGEERLFAGFLICGELRVATLACPQQWP